MKLQYLVNYTAAMITCAIFNLPAEQKEIFGERINCAAAAIVATDDFECAPPISIRAIHPEQKNCSVKKKNCDCHDAVTSALARYKPRIGVNFTAYSSVNSPTSRTTSFVDAIGAVGPEQYIICTNNGIVSFDKKTGKPDGIFETTLTSFASAVFPYPYSIASDPEIRYDTFSKRWYIVLFEEDFGQPGDSNHFLISFSDGPVIKKNTVWTQYSFVTNQVPPPEDFGEFFDFEGLGIDAHALYIGYLSESTSDGSFQDSTAFVIQKASLFNGGPVVINRFPNLLSQQNMQTVRGVDNLDDPNPQFGYFMGGFVTSENTQNIGVIRVNNPGSTSPSLSPAMMIPNTEIISFGELDFGFLNIPLVPHKGNIRGLAGFLDYEAGTFFNPHIRDNHLFGAIGTVVNSSGIPDLDTWDRGACFFYELDLSPSVPTVVQTGKLFDPTPTTTPVWYFMPTCMTNANHDLIMGFTIAGANEFVNAGVVGRFGNDPLGTFSPVVRVTNNNKFTFNAGSRWGDYCHSSPDPDGKRIWTILEFVGNHNSYAEQVTEFLPPKE